MIDYTLQTILIGTTILGITSGLLGVFILLRHQSLLSDAISHAALPGIALIFLVTHTKNPFLLMCGGAITGAIGTILMHIITKSTSLKKDAALGIVLSVFFGCGLVLMTIIQKQPIANQSILNKFLFGNVSTLLHADLYAMAGIACIVLLCMQLFWKELTLITFDPGFAHALGFSVFALDILLTVLMVFAIVIGLQTVGVVLMSTMLIAPAAAARQWTSNIKVMTILAVLFAVTSGMIGAVLSSLISQLPTGPTIVVVLSTMVISSLLFAPHRGVMYHRRKI